MKLMMVLLLSVLISQAADESVVRTLGTWKALILEDTVTFTIYERPGEERSIMLRVSDKHRINNVALMGTVAEMKELMAKLAKTISEAEKK